MEQVCRLFCRLLMMFLCYSNQASYCITVCTLVDMVFCDIQFLYLLSVCHSSELQDDKVVLVQNMFNEYTQLLQV